MFSLEHIAQIKAISLPGYLAGIGFQPVSNQGGELLYLSPLRSERTPSFSVHKQQNIFNDFGDVKARGDIIRFVQLWKGCNFPEAVKELERYQSQPNQVDFSFSGPICRPDAKKDVIKALKLLQNKALVSYCQQRNISFPVARKYLKEVYYQHGDKAFFALGFANDKEGYELRTRIGERDVKRCLGPKSITTIAGANQQAVNVFEGFFDFLSALEYYQQPAPRCPTVVLNSTTTLESALPYLSTFQSINAYLDQDISGQKTLQKLQESGLKVIDRSSIYDGFKDFNEFWKVSATTRTSNRSA